METPKPAAILLRTTEVSRLLQLSPAKVSAMARAGEIPHVRFGRSLRYPIEEIQAWVRRNTRRDVEA